MRFGAVRTSAESDAGRAGIEVVKERGKGRWFVVQDKASAVPCSGFWHVSERTHDLFPRRATSVGRLYRTAEITCESFAEGLRSLRLQRVRGAIEAIVGTAIAAVLLIAIGKAFGLLISTTDSAAPAGIYRITHSELKRGELVAACLPIPIAQYGLARGYLRAGGCPGNAEPVSKIILGFPGDEVDIERPGVSVNGERFSNSPVAEHDSTGRNLTHVEWGTHIVRPREVWLFGFNDLRSWDARYFGPIPLSSLRGNLKPVLTW